jgi:hypothetical protein
MAGNSNQPDGAGAPYQTLSGGGAESELSPHDRSLLADIKRDQRTAGAAGACAAAIVFPILVLVPWFRSPTAFATELILFGLITIALFVAFLASARLYRFDCPRCRHRFFRVTPDPFGCFASRCRSCGLDLKHGDDFFVQRLGAMRVEEELFRDS